jgi:5-formyltetrahydrofolate cyclo-ligase
LRPAGAAGDAAQHAGLGDNRPVHPVGSYDTAARKTELRATLLAARAARPPAELDHAREAVRATVLAVYERKRWSCVAAYEPLRTEPGSVPLLRALRERGVRVLVPVLRPDRDLDWTEWDGTARGPRELLGVAAITQAQAVLVPALAVARDGVRLGRGGGSYDRALPRVGRTAPRVALLFTGELVDKLPADPWDARVSDVVTPAGWQQLPC